MYELLRSSRKVARLQGIAKGTVLRIVGKQGIKIPPWGQSPERVKAMLDGHVAGISGPKVAAALGTSCTTVYSHWKKNGLASRSVSDYNYEENCYHDFFDAIDSPIKAYIVGLLVADGCVSDEHEVILSLKVGDAYMVYWFRDTLGSKATVTIQQEWKSIDGGKPFWAASAAVRIRSRRMCAALASLSLLPRKTCDPRMVTGIPRKFEGDFWRGAVDGDGWLCFSPRKSWSLQFIVGFTGGWPLVEAFQDYCRKLCPTHAKIHPNHSIWRFTVTDWFGYEVARHMYGNATMCLDRKYELFQCAVEYFRGRIRRTRNWRRPDAVSLHGSL